MRRGKEKHIDVRITPSECHSEGYVGKVTGELEAVLLSNRHFCQIYIFRDMRVLFPASLCWNSSAQPSQAIMLSFVRFKKREANAEALSAVFCFSLKGYLQHVAQ